MSPTPPSAWKCTVCGYVHRGPQPLDSCPVCGAPEEAFEAHAEPVAAAAPPARRWRCLVCDYLHEGNEPPESCPVCGAGADQFVPEAAPAAIPSAAGGSRRIAIVGGGVAGVAAAEAARQAAPQAEIVLLSREVELPYLRLNLTRFLAGEVEAAALPLHPEAWYCEHRVDLRRGAEVRRLDLAERRCCLADGTAEGYDRLVLAAGAHPFVPPFPGTEKRGVTCLRTLADACEVLERVRAGARCVCIGGGILGLETAGALARQGASVALLESHGWLLPRQLNQQAGRVLARHVLRAGIELLHGASTAALSGDSSVDGVVLQDGRHVPADLVVIATGVRANTHLAREAGLSVGQGVVVDDCLFTSHPDVLAAGDVAEHRGVLYGLWMASLAQGRIAGMNAAGLRAEFAGIPRANMLKVLGVELFSVGKVGADDASYQVVEAEDEDTYFGFVVRDGRLVGAILMGDAGLSGTATAAIQDGADLSGLLLRRPTAGQVMAHLAEHGSGRSGASPAAHT